MRIPKELYTKALAILATGCVFPKGTFERLWFGKQLSNCIGLSTSLLAAAVSSVFDDMIDEHSEDAQTASQRKLYISLPVSIVMTYCTAPSVPYALAFGGASYVLQRVFHAILRSDVVQNSSLMAGLAETN